jgi:hypothetical protein
LIVAESQLFFRHLQRQHPSHGIGRRRRQRGQARARAPRRSFTDEEVGVVRLFRDTGEQAKHLLVTGVDRSRALCR